MKSRPWLILLIAWLGWVFDIMDTAISNFARQPMLMQLMDLQPTERAKMLPVEGQMQTIFLVGWAIGGLAFGVLADKWGRTKTMMLTIAIYCVFTGLTAFCPNLEILFLLRFLTGLGIGGEWAAGAALVAESFEDKMRPLAASVLQTAAAIGPWTAAFFGWKVLKEGWIFPGMQGWQTLWLLGFFPAIVGLAIRVWVPEPERKVEAGSALMGLKGLMSERAYLGRAALVLGIGAVGIAGAGNATYWLPNLVNQTTTDLNEVSARLSFATTIMHVGTLIGVFFFPFIAKTLGRKTALIGGFTLGLFSTCALVMVPPTYLAVLVMAPIIAFSCIGVSAVFGLYFPELFPSRIRATGAGLGYNFARLLTAPLAWGTGLLMQQTGSGPMLGVGLAGLIYVIGIGLVLIAPETKDQPLPA